MTDAERIELQKLAEMLVRELREDEVSWSACDAYVMDDEGNEVCEVINAAEVYRHSIARYIASLSPRVVLRLLRDAAKGKP